MATSLVEEEPLVKQQSVEEQVAEQNVRDEVGGGDEKPREGEEAATDDSFRDEIVAQDGAEEGGEGGDKKPREGEEAATDDSFRDEIVAQDGAEEGGEGSDEKPREGEEAATDDSFRDEIARDGAEGMITPSAVETAVATDAVEDGDDPTIHHPLSLTWCFSFNRSLPVHNISTDERRMLFYASSHTGVLYDCENNRQCLLQGHGNLITCTAVSGDKRWLVTGDQGENSLLTVWDSFSGVPVRTLFEGFGSGCEAVGLSHDALYLAALTSGSPQALSLWRWTETTETPMCSVQLGDHTHQSHLTFHPSNHDQILTTGETHVVFYDWDGKKLHHSSNQITEMDFDKSSVGVFSQSVFIPGSQQLALTGTSFGLGVVWAPLKNGSKERKPLKLMRLHDHPVTTITTTNSLVVTGDSQGLVKFFSPELKVLHRYDSRQGCGSLVSISFAYNKDIPTPRECVGEYYPTQSTLEAPPLVVPDFTLSSSSSTLVHVTVNGTITEVLFQGHSAAVHALAAHPSLPRLATAGYSTLLQLWDYNTKEVLVSREFEEPNFIQCISFDPSGEFIGVGFTSGVVLVVDSLELNDSSPIFRYSRQSVTHLSFSHNSLFMATADQDHCVTLYKKQLVEVEEEREGEDEEEEDKAESKVLVTWEFMAKYRSHYKPIESLLFGVGLDSDSSRLISLGQDRMLVEYDVEHSDTDNLRILSSNRIEQSGIPTSVTWYPPVSKESFLLLSNDQFKLKLVNSTTKMCRKTLLAPTFGTPLRGLEVLPGQILYSKSGEQIRRYAAFYTFDRVGLLLLPHDGNPHNSQSLIAHPTGVTAMAVSCDGNYVFTAGGGKDCTVNMWTTNTQALEAASKLGGEDLEPFYALIDGGRYGDFYAEMEQFFYYAQIKSQGVKTQGERKVSTTIPVDQIPDVMRAVGFFPSEQDIDDILNEIKFSDYIETGKPVTEIDLPTFIRLYINHRPAFGLSPIHLLQAFHDLATAADEDEEEEKSPGFSVDRESLLAMIQEHGEHMSESEVVESLMTLLGHCQDPERDGAFSVDPETALDEDLPESVSAAHFAEKVLHLTLQTPPLQTPQQSKP